MKFLLDVLTVNCGKLAVCAEGFVHLYKLDPKDKILMPKVEKKYREACRNQITEPKQIFHYFLHGVQAGKETATIVMFGNPSVIGMHIGHFNCDPKSPLWDENLRRSQQHPFLGMQHWLLV
jgi:hypothetical protein